MLVVIAAVIVASIHCLLWTQSWAQDISSIIYILRRILEGSDVISSQGEELILRAHYCSLLESQKSLRQSLSFFQQNYLGSRPESQ